MEDKTLLTSQKITAQRTQFIYCIGLVLVALFIVGCNGDDGNRVSFVVFGDPPEQRAYEALVAAFEEAHPEIDVQMSHIPSQAEYRQRLAADFSSGRPTDVFLLNYRRFASFAEQGGLEPLSTRLAESELLNETDFFDVTIDSFLLDDELWCIPQNISSLVVYYNKDLFDAANVPYPSDDWTRAEFVEAARALTQNTDDARNAQYAVGLDPSIFRLAPFVWQDGLDIVDDRENPTRLTLDDPQVLETFQWFVDLQVVEGVVPDRLAESAETSQSRFLNGTLAMIFNSRRGTPTYRTIDKFEWDVGPLPRGATSAGILHTDGYCMSAQTINKDAAWTFIEFANSAEGQTLIADSGRTVPSNRHVAESSAFLDPNQPPANSQVWIDTIDTLGRVPTMTTWVGVEETASKEIERAFFGEVSVLEAAQTANELTETFFEQHENRR